MAARKATAADLAALRECVARMEAQLDDFAVREATDRDFHCGSRQSATGNGSLELVVEELWNQRAEMWRRMQQHFHTRELAQKTMRDHAAILRAIAARDPEAARAAMHRHLARVEREFQRDDDGARQCARRAGAKRGRVAA